MNGSPTLRAIAIVGPTASGKTGLAVHVAHALGSEIVSADSRQVYRGLDLGTGKDLDEYRRVSPPVPLHLVDIADPGDTFTLVRYQTACHDLLRRMAREERFGSGQIPLVLAGGTGLYIEAILRGFRIPSRPPDPAVRQRLEARPHGELARELGRRAPDLASRTDLLSMRRVVRALELLEAAGPVETTPSLGIPIRWAVFGVAIDPAELRSRIARRLEERLAGGLVDEVRRLLAAGVDPAWLDALGLEYREIVAHLRGEKSERRMVSDLRHAIGRFAKRQRTWFRGMERRGVPIRWVGPDQAETILAAATHDDAFTPIAPSVPTRRAEGE